MGVAVTVAPKGLGPQDPTKKLAHWVNLLGQPLTRKLVFENFGPEPLIRTKFKDEIYCPQRYKNVPYLPGKMIHDPRG